MSTGLTSPAGGLIKANIIQAGALEEAQRLAHEAARHALKAQTEAAFAIKRVALADELADSFVLVNFAKVAEEMLKSNAAFSYVKFDPALQPLDDRYLISLLGQVPGRSDTPSEKHFTTEEHFFTAAYAWAGDFLKSVKQIPEFAIIEADAAKYGLHLNLEVLSVHTYEGRNYFRPEAKHRETANFVLTASVDPVEQPNYGMYFNNITERDRNGPIINAQDVSYPEIPQRRMALFQRRALESAPAGAA